MKKGSKIPMGGSTPSVGSMIPPQVYIYLIGIPVVVGVAYFGIIRPILKKTGVIESPEDKEVEKINDTMVMGKYWSPSWYKANGGVSISEQQAINEANALVEGVDYFWGTDEEKIWGVFERLGSKGNISKVSEAYARINNESLIERLKSELGDDDLMVIASKISNYN